LKTCLNDLAADAASLKFGVDRHGTEREPPVLRRRTHFRERDMADDSLIEHGDERQG
jgi:hypothetical protein